MFIGFLLQLFVFVFNKLTPKKQLYFEIGSGYQIELNVTQMKVSKEKKVENDCALIPLKDQPKHTPLF